MTTANRISFLLTTVSILSFTSCFKDQKILNNLEGRWFLTSLTQNGQEFLDNDNPGGTIDFDVYDKEAEKGDFELVIFDETGKFDEGDIGTYTLLSDGNKIELDGIYSGPIIYDFEWRDDNNTLILFTTIAGTVYRYEAER